MALKDHRLPPDAQLGEIPTEARSGKPEEVDAYCQAVSAALSSDDERISALIHDRLDKAAEALKLSRGTGAQLATIYAERAEEAITEAAWIWHAWRVREGESDPTTLEKLGHSIPSVATDMLRLSPLTSWLADRAIEYADWDPLANQRARKERAQRQISKYADDLERKQQELAKLVGALRQTAQDRDKAIDLIHALQGQLAAARSEAVRVTVRIQHPTTGDLKLHVLNAQATARARVQTANNDLRRLESQRAALLADPATNLADAKGGYQQTLAAIDHARELLRNATGQLWSADGKDPADGTVAKQAADAAVAAEEAAAYPLSRQASRRKATAAPVVAAPAAAPAAPPEPPVGPDRARPLGPPPPPAAPAAAPGPSLDEICDALLDGLLSGLEGRRW